MALNRECTAHDVADLQRQSVGVDVHRLVCRLAQLRLHLRWAWG